ncbi:MAG: hypothetical protein GC159_20635 [Phycisphaera sp.]|nr:hypothetical protein [Phycisphaera sp.]
MPLLAQCGYGRSDKIEQGIAAGSITGVILSPRDERRDRLESFYVDLRRGASDFAVMFDPQFYAATLSNVRDGNLAAYPYYANNTGLSRNQFRPRQIEAYVRNCLDYQMQSLPGLDYLISPSVPFDDFRDSWSQIALSMAEAAIDDCAQRDDAPPLLVTIVLSEAALRDPTKMNEFLDTLSALDVPGFYFLVQRTSNTLDPAMDTTSLTNLLFLVYVLATLNEFEVVVGYSDWMGFLFQAVGATLSASGWHNSLKQFSLARYLPQTGGRRPRKRYSSLPLLSCPLVVPELEDIHRLGLLPTVLTGGSHDHILSGGPARGETAWTDAISCLAHWESLSRLYATIESHRTVQARLNAVDRVIRSAQTSFTRLESSGVQFERTTGPDHLDTWADAVAGFRHEASI